MKKFMYIAACILCFASAAKAQEPSMELPENVSPEQLKAVFKEAMKAEFDKMDANGDGQISKKEFVDYQIAEVKAKSNNNFKKLDADDDGYLSEHEIMSAMQETMQKISEQIQNLRNVEDSEESFE